MNNLPERGQNGWPEIILSLETFVFALTTDKGSLQAGSAVLYEVIANLESLLTTVHRNNVNSGCLPNPAIQIWGGETPSAPCSTFSLPEVLYALLFLLLVLHPMRNPQHHLK